MARHDSSAAGSILVAFLLGAISGAAVALLMAPAPGEETRRRLGERAREGRDRAGDVARHGRDFLSRQRETLQTAFERGREAYEQARAGGEAPRTPESPDAL